MDDQLSGSDQSFSRARRLPTRVSNACDRCRKLKQRCDVLQPCSTCLNASRECIRSIPTKTTMSIGRPAKRARRDISPRSVPTITHAAEAMYASQSHDPSHVGEQSTARHISRLPVTNQSQSQSPVQQRVEPSVTWGQTSAQPVRSATSISKLSDTSWEDRSIVAELGSSSSAMDITRRVLQQRGSDQSTGRATFAIPGGDFDARRSSAIAYHRVFTLIGAELPSKSICDKLLDIYFVTVHWFSLVVYEPTFRKRYEAIISSGLARSADRPFLLLLLMILVMSCQYGHNLADDDIQSEVHLDSLRIEYLKIVRQNFMDLLDEDSLEFVQICTLLGSYWLYWGKPRSSFTILGAAVKSAQAISLHRQANWRITNSDIHMIEESKRVWWTIYTWDRFATVVYGRPLGINDKDCDILMPAEFTEHIIDPQPPGEAADIVLSTYQAQLNMVYQLASPLLENIYGIRSLGNRMLSEMAQTVHRVSDSMETWYCNLPIHLDLNQIADLPTDPNLQQRMHSLQALSLHLTYFNLMIIIHRPLLADWRSRRTPASRAQSVHGGPLLADGRARRTPASQAQSPHGEASSDNEELTGAEKQIYDTGFQQCLKAALAVSQLERSKPSLINLAGKSHLMSFLAMNVFTSSVVLFICALSDTLSDASQEAKRGMARNLRILRALSATGSLPSQCSTIIQDLIQIVMDKEKEQMLLGPLDSQERCSPRAVLSQFQQDQRRTAGPNVASAPTYQSERSQPHHNPNEVYEPSGVPYGRTMEHLHRVLKNTSHARATQHVELPTLQPLASTGHQDRIDPSLDPAWANPMSWDAAYLLGGETYAQDMNQFWLWNMDNENHTNWSDADWNT